METINVVREKYNEYKAKAELYDSYIKQCESMFNVRGGGIMQDFTNFIKALETTKQGKVSIYCCKGGNLAILPYEYYLKLLENREVFVND